MNDTLLVHGLDRKPVTNRWFVMPMDRGDDGIRVQQSAWPNFESDLDWRGRCHDDDGHHSGAPFRFECDATSPCSRHGGWRTAQTGRLISNTSWHPKSISFSHAKVFRADTLKDEFTAARIDASIAVLAIQRFDFNAPFELVALILETPDRAKHDRKEHRPQSINLEGDVRCVDIFQRPDGTFGFEEYRRDPEDGRGWFAIGGHSMHSFASAGEAREAAQRVVKWLAMG